MNQEELNKMYAHVAHVLQNNAMFSSDYKATLALHAILMTRPEEQNQENSLPKYEIVGEDDGKI